MPGTWGGSHVPVLGVVLDVPKILQRELPPALEKQLPRGACPPSQPCMGLCNEMQATTGRWQQQSNTRAPAGPSQGKQPPAGGDGYEQRPANSGGRGGGRGKHPSLEKSHELNPPTPTQTTLAWLRSPGLSSTTPLCLMQVALATTLTTLMALAHPLLATGPHSTRSARPTPTGWRPTWLSTSPTTTGAHLPEQGPHAHWPAVAHAVRELVPPLPLSGARGRGHCLRTH